MKKRYWFFILPVLLLTSCYYDSDEKLYDSGPCKTGDISYRSDIVPILAVNCDKCHSIEDAPVSGDGLILQGYNNLTVYLESHEETFISSIEHTGKGIAMPKNGTKLDKCSIQAFKDWIDQGELDN